MKKQLSVVTLAALILALNLVALITPSNTHALNPNQKAWADYADAQQWFKIAYPSAYQVTSPINKPGAYGGVHTFSSGRKDGQVGLQIVVGLHTTQRDLGTPLEAWAVQQLFASSMFTAAQLHYLTRTVVLDKLNAQNTAASADEQRVTAVVLEGSSPASPEWKTTQIPYGNVVFFVWTNSRKPTDALIYDLMVNSLRFTAKTPRTLQVAYGITPTKAPQPTSLHSQ